MPVEIPPGFAQVTFHFYTPAPGGVHQSVCTLGVGIGPVGTLASVAGIVGNRFWVDHLSGDTADNVILDRVVAVNAADYGEVTYGVAGARSGATSPPQVCTLVRKRTGQRGPHNHGRMYWPGLLTDSEVADDGSIDAGRASDLQAAFDAIFTSLVEDEEIQPVVLHQEGYDGDPTVITNFQVSLAIATQRRRLRRF